MGYVKMFLSIICTQILMATQQTQSNSNIIASFNFPLNNITIIQGMLYCNYIVEWEIITWYYTYCYFVFAGYKYLKFQYYFIVTGNTLMFITSSQAATLFPNTKIQAEMEVSRSDFITDSEQENNNTTNRTSWNQNEIIELISLYKSQKHLFKSTTMKNDKVWDMIAQKLLMHTTEQIKNKFKYLKQKYMKKKDNMSQKSSGAGTIKFDYFFEIDEIFGQDVQPASTASSLRGIQCASKTSSVEIEENSCSDDKEITTKKNE